ncbi:hypothetical protein BC941DRAFT_518787 [Chlamydoabsidia padenii]|nr:hypothetical protein BC941DRAFT_518787 [Chlamydoabsidia padenii]
MPKTVTLIAGLVVASAVAYQFKDDIEKETRVIQHLQALSTLDTIQEKDDSLDTTFSLANSQNYIKQRLIPSVKANWNDQVTKLTHAMIDNDLPTQANRLWTKHVLGHSDE